MKYLVNKSADFSFDYLSNMKKFVTIHPVVTRMKHLGGNKYRVYETFRYGLLPFSFTYPATIEADYENKIIVMRFRVMKINKIEMIFQIREFNGQSIIQEDLKLETILPMKSFMKNMFIKSHIRLFKNLDKLII